MFVPCSLCHCAGVCLTPDAHASQLLDVGCGIGGGDFYISRDFGVEVVGIDLSTNMLAIANERISAPENGAPPCSPWLRVVRCASV